MDAVAEIGRNPAPKHQIQPEYGDEQADAGRDSAELVSRVKFPGAHGDREILIFPVSLATSKGYYPSGNPFKYHVVALSSQPIM